MVPSGLEQKPKQREGLLPEGLVPGDIRSACVTAVLGVRPWRDGQMDGPAGCTMLSVLG
jgi:hypothetical protein